MQNAGVSKSMSAANSNHAFQTPAPSPAGAANGGQQPGRAIINNLVKPSRMSADLHATEDEGDRKRQKSAVLNSEDTNPAVSLFQTASGKLVPLASNSFGKAMQTMGGDGGQQFRQSRQDLPFAAPRAVQDQCSRGPEGAGSAGGSAFRPAFPVGNERDYAGGAAIAEVHDVTGVSVDEWGFEVEGFWDTVDLTAIDAVVEETRAANARRKRDGFSANASRAAVGDRGKSIATDPSESGGGWSEGTLFKNSSGRLVSLSSAASRIASIFFGEDDESPSCSGTQHLAAPPPIHGFDQSGRGKAIMEPCVRTHSPAQSSSAGNRPQPLPQPNSFGGFGVASPPTVEKNSGPTFRPPGQQTTAFRPPRRTKQ